MTNSESVARIEPARILPVELIALVLSSSALATPVVDVVEFELVLGQVARPP